MTNYSYEKILNDDWLAAQIERFKYPAKFFDFQPVDHIDSNTEAYYQFQLAAFKKHSHQPTQKSFSDLYGSVAALQSAQTKEAALAKLMEIQACASYLAQNNITVEHDQLQHQLERLSLSIEAWRETLTVNAELTELATVLSHTTTLLNSKDREAFKKALASMDFPLEKHVKFEKLGYVSAGVIAFIGLVLAANVALPFLALFALAAGVAYYGRSHAQDPRRMIGEQLHQIMENKALESSMQVDPRTQPDGLSSMYGV